MNENGSHDCKGNSKPLTLLQLKQISLATSQGHPIPSS